MISLYLFCSLRQAPFSRPAIRISVQRYYIFYLRTLQFVTYSLQNCVSVKNVTFHKVSDTFDKLFV